MWKLSKNAEVQRTLDVVMFSVVQNFIHTVASVCERFDVKSWSTCVNDISKNWNFYTLNFGLPIPLAALPKAWVCGRSLAGIVDSNPTGGMDVCLLWVLCMLSGRCLCDNLITHPGESYWLWCVIVCELETSWMRRPWPTGGLLRRIKENWFCVKWIVLL
jgi:hypothetical protein